MSVALVVHNRYHVIVQKVGGSNLLSYVCVCVYIYTLFHVQPEDGV